MNTAPPTSGRRALVIGGGITGLAAALRLADGGARVTVLEATSRTGGKLYAGELAGSRVDLGAESMLARRPEGLELARRAGLGDDLEPPATASAAIWTRGALRPLPPGQVMGVPGDPAALAGVISESGVARAAQDTELLPTPIGEDTAIGAYVAARLGREVVDRLVEPLLGGVYAGDAYRISLRAAVPELYRAAREQRSLLAAVRSIRERSAGTAPAGPVFMGIRGGMGRLPLAVADACRARGVVIETGTEVRELRRTGGTATGGSGPAAGPGPAWTAVTADGRTLPADAVVLAVPAPAAGTLLAAEAPGAAAELQTVEYASMALMTFAFRRADLGTAPPGSGFLVPPVDGRTIKAATFSSGKWGWVAAQDPELFLLRTSVGRWGEEQTLQREDDELIHLSLHDLRTATGLTAVPVASRVTRWERALPQYPVGHLDRVARIRTETGRLPGLALCGAAYDGVGIPACIASAHAAADLLLTTPPPSPPPSGTSER